MDGPGLGVGQRNPPTPNMSDDRIGIPSPQPCLVRLQADTGHIYLQNTKMTCVCPSQSDGSPHVDVASNHLQPSLRDTHNKFLERVVFERLCGLHLAPDWARKLHFSRQARRARRKMRRWVERAPWRHISSAALDPLAVHYHETLASSLEREFGPVSKMHVPLLSFCLFLRLCIEPFDVTVALTILEAYAGSRVDSLNVRCYPGITVSGLVEAVALQYATVHGCEAFDAIGRAESRYVFKVSGLTEYLLHSDWRVMDYHWVAIARRKHERLHLELKRLDNDTVIKLAPARAITLTDMHQRDWLGCALYGDYDESEWTVSPHSLRTTNNVLEEADAASDGEFDSSAALSPSVASLMTLSDIPPQVAWRVLVHRSVHCPGDLPSESLEIELQLFNAGTEDEILSGTGTRVHSRTQVTALITKWVPSAVLQHPRATKACTLPRSTRLTLTVFAIGSLDADACHDNVCHNNISVDARSDPGAASRHRLSATKDRIAIAQVGLPIVDDCGLLRTGNMRLHLWPCDAIRAARRLKDVKTADYCDVQVSDKKFDWCITGGNPQRDAGALDVTFLLDGVTNPVFADDVPTMGDLLWTKNNQNTDEPILGLDRLCYLNDGNSSTSANGKPGFCEKYRLSFNILAMAHKDLQPTSATSCLEENHSISTLLCRAPLRRLSQHERESLWEYREKLRLLPEIMPIFSLAIPRQNRDAFAEARVFAACHWWQYRNIQEARCCRRWGILSAQTRVALACLSAQHADCFTRAFACQLLDELADKSLFEIFLQLTQALKLEAQHDSALARLLIRRAACSPLSLGHRLFWLLRAEMHLPGFSERYGVVLHAFLSCLDSDFCDRLDAECKLDSILSNVAARVKHHPTRAARQHCAQRWLTAANHALKDFETERHQRLAKRLGVNAGTSVHNAWKAIHGYSTCLNPALRCGRIRVEQCKVLTSKKLPLYVVLQNCDWRGDDFHLIFKDGDDLRQDQLTLQLLRLMDGLWRNAGLDLQMLPYVCVATGHNTGMIEVVPSATTTADIQVEYGGGAKGAFNDQVVSSFLLQHNRDATQYERAQQSFLKTCAGYCVATHVLGIGDRHADNIMVTKRGRLFHIDFGHFLGNFKFKYGVRRERSPFVFTPEMKRVIVHTPGRITEQIRLLHDIRLSRGDVTGHFPLGYPHFEHLCRRAYNVFASLITG